MSETTRVERDTMGEIELCGDVLWGANTERARRNLPIAPNRPMPMAMIRALARIKAAYVAAAGENDSLPAECVAAIAVAAQEVVDGRHDAQFPLDVFQTGSGTSSNMNVNEVLANLANLSLGGKLGEYKPVHPNDHVNFGQSSNDTVPAALHLAALEALDDRLLPALDELIASIHLRAEKDGHVLKCARTHWQDALPISFGHIFRAYASVLGTLRQSLADARPGLCVLPLGGTACGTGFQAPIGLPARACEHLSQVYGAPLVAAKEPLAYMAGRPVVTDLMGRLAALAAELSRIANDLRVMASGPRLGLGEITLPDLQPGSSIMPGKVNPVVCESLVQIHLAVTGQHATVLAAAAQGQFELNVTFPITAEALLGAIALLAQGAEILRTRAILGLTLNEKALARDMDRSLALATGLIGKIGYAQAAQVAKRAYAEGKSVASAALAMGLLAEDERETYLDPARLARPGRPSKPKS